MNRTVRIIAFLWFFLAFGGLSRAGQAPSADQRAAVQAAYQRGLDLLAAGRAADAAVFLDEALRQDPRNPRLLNLRGLAASQLHRSQEAEASFRKVIMLSPHWAAGYTNLAVLLSQTGRWEEAAGFFRAALRQEPGDFAALVGLGTMLSRLKKFPAAAPYLEKAWRARPEDFQGGYEYALVLHELKRPEEAERVLRRMNAPRDGEAGLKYDTLAAVVAGDLGDRAAELGWYCAAYQLSPGSFEIYSSLLRAWTGQPANAAQATLPPPPADLSAEEHFALGLLLASHGHSQEAIPEFEATLQMEPASESAAYNLALAYQSGGNARAAGSVLQKALDRRPSAALFDLRATLEEGAGEYVAAARDFRRAVELDPANEQYYFDLGAEYLTHFTFGAALEIFRTGTEKFPKSLRQSVGKGLAHFALREYAPAAEAFLAALQLDPASPVALAAWNALPTFLAATDWEKLLPRLKRLAEEHPNTPQALYCLGVTLSRAGVARGDSKNLLAARSLLERAVHLKPGFADAHLEIGNMDMAEKQTAQAVREFREAIRLNPDSEIAHYRLGQAYRDLKQLGAAQKELARYQELSSARQEQMARSRSAIKQFILASSMPSSAASSSPIAPARPH